MKTTALITMMLLLTSFAHATSSQTPLSTDAIEIANAMTTANVQKCVQEISKVAGLFDFEITQGEIKTSTESWQRIPNVEVKYYTLRGSALDSALNNRQIELTIKKWAPTGLAGYFCSLKVN